MKFFFRRNGVRASLFLASSLALGCFDSGKEVAGAQDFPNSLDELARLASQGLRETGSLSHSGERGATPTVADTVRSLPPDSAFLPWSGSSLPLVRRAVGLDSAWRSIGFDSSQWFYQDTAQGRARYIHSWKLGGLFQSDTFEVAWNDKARDSILGNEDVIAQRSLFRLGDSGVTWVSHLRDTSGDYRADWRRVETIHPPSAGAERRQITEEGPGTDGNFNTYADNTLLLQAELLSWGGDTLRYQAQADADRDGVIWFGGKDSNEIDFSGVAKGDSAGPGLIRAAYGLHAVFDVRRPEQSHPTRYFGRLDGLDKSVTRIWIFGPRPDSAAAPGDTVSFLLQTEYADTASTQSFSLVGRLLLPNTALDYGSARLLDASGEFLLRRSSYALARFALSDLDVRLDELTAPWKQGRLEVTGQMLPGGSDSLSLRPVGEMWKGTARSADGRKWDAELGSGGAVFRPR